MKRRLCRISLLVWIRVSMPNVFWQDEDAKNMNELEAKLAKAARDHDKLCSSLYEKRSAILKSSDGDGPAGIPDFWLGVLQAICSCVLRSRMPSYIRLPSQGDPEISDYISQGDTEVLAFLEVTVSMVRCSVHGNMTPAYRRISESRSVRTSEWNMSTMRFAQRLCAFRDIRCPSSIRLFSLTVVPSCRSFGSSVSPFPCS